MGLSEATGAAVGQPRFLRDGYRLLVRTALVLGALAAVMAGVLLFLMLTYAPQVVFIGDRGGEGMMRLPPLSQPEPKDTRIVADWLSPRAQALFTLDRDSVADRLVDEQPHFTQSGFDSYRQALVQVGLLSGAGGTTGAASQVAAVPAGQIGLAGAAPLDGVFTWQLQVPLTLTVTRDGADAPQTMQVVALFWVQRSASLVDNPALILHGVQLKMAPKPQ